MANGKYNLTLLLQSFPLQYHTNNMAKLTTDDVKHVAKLANLPLTDEEIKKFQEQLSSVVSYIDELQEVDTKDVEPTSQTTGLENVFR